jgi:DNA-directed RNA polymerase specialized sigma24 family protein
MLGQSFPYDARASVPLRILLEQPWVLRIDGLSKKSQQDRAGVSVLNSSMYIDDPSMVNSLKGLVARLTWNPVLEPDLLQEALIHLWLTETRRPGQTPSWYLQSCKFHLQHYLSSGRSVDSAKRRGQQVDLNIALEAESEGIRLMELEDSLLNEVSARDLISFLSPHLSNDGRAVLNCLSEGLGPREIGRRLKMSHSMVVRHRCRIAEVLTRLDKPYSAQWRALARSGASIAPRTGDRFCNLNFQHVPAFKEASAKSPATFAKDSLPALRAA